MTPNISQYDSWSMVMPKSVVTIDPTLVSAFGFSENSTDYMLNQSGMMVNNCTEIVGRNSLITSVQPTYTLSLYQSGYLAQQTVMVIPYNVPVVLGCSVTVKNRTVSIVTNMTISCDRNTNGSLNDQLLIIKLPANGFNYSLALDADSNSIDVSNPTLRIPIMTSSSRIITTTITSLINLNYIPNINSKSVSPSDNISNIQFTTVTTLTTASGTSQEVVGAANISSSQFVTNQAYEINNLESTRNSTVSGSYTNITVDYQTILGKLQDIMQITLPSGQNSFAAGMSNCFVGAGQICNIVASNTTDLLISLIPNSSVLLTNVINSYPNANYIRVRILTNPQQQLIEEGSTLIEPPISLWRISITGNATSTRIADISYMFFQLTPIQLRINSTNVIKISIPPKVFTRTFNSDDCAVKVPGSITTFGGCTYSFDTEGWLRNVTVGSIGSYGIDINTTLNINFSVTNSWTSYQLSDCTFVATVFVDSTTYASQGTIVFATVYHGLSSFVPVGVSLTSSSVSQPQNRAGSQSVLLVSLVLNGNIGKGTVIALQLPKDSFIYSAAVNPKFTVLNEDSNYYYIVVPTTCSSSGCMNFSDKFNLSVTNNFFVKKQTNSLIMSAQYDNLPCSQPFTIQSMNHVPMNLPALTLTRNDSVSATWVAISLSFGLAALNTLNISGITEFGELQIDISKNISSSEYLNTAYEFSQQNSKTMQFQQVSGVTVFTNADNISFVIPANCSNSSATSLVAITGRNKI
jgi:hypothetical protein